METEYRAYCDRWAYAEDTKLVLFKYERDERGRYRSYHATLNWIEHPEGGVYPSDEVVAQWDDVRDSQKAIVQEIVNAAYKRGIVPEQLDDARAELGATKSHLKDMRVLAFGLLELDKEDANT